MVNVLINFLLFQNLTPYFALRLFFLNIQKKKKKFISWRIPVGMSGMLFPGFFKLLPCFTTKYVNSKLDFQAKTKF